MRSKRQPRAGSGSFQALLRTLVSTPNEVQRQQMVFSRRVVATVNCTRTTSCEAASSLRQTLQIHVYHGNCPQMAARGRTKSVIMTLYLQRTVHSFEDRMPFPNLQKPLWTSDGSARRTIMRLLFLKGHLVPILKPEYKLAREELMRPLWRNLQESR